MDHYYYYTTLSVSLSHSFGVGQENGNIICILFAVQVHTVHSWQIVNDMNTSKNLFARIFDKFNHEIRACTYQTAVISKRSEFVPYFCNIS